MRINHAILRRLLMLVGYARVSTQDQNLYLQQSALTQAGCTKIYEDQMSGIRSERPGLKLAFEVLREGDTLIVWKLDRLGRSVKSLVDFIGELAGRGVHFKSLTDSIDTTNPSGRFFFHVMAKIRVNSCILLNFSISFKRENFAHNLV